MEGEEIAFEVVKALQGGSDEATVDFFVGEEVIEELPFGGGLLHGLDEDFVGFIGQGESGSEVSVYFGIGWIVGEDLINDAIELLSGH